MIKTIVLMMALSILTACGGSNSSQSDSPDVAPPTTPIVEGTWYQPKVFSTWHIQLDGDINTDYSVDVYIIDLFDVSTKKIATIKATGKHVICYFSGGTYEDWRSDAKDFSSSTLGNKLDEWEGERWLDVTDASVYEIMLARLDLAKEKGCEGVDIDNMDGYTNHPGFDYSENDQLTYNISLANAAHERELAVGLKNDLNQITLLVSYFDFAVNEQCFSYNECDLIAPFIADDKPVFNIEYAQEYVESNETRDMICSDSINRKFSSLILPLDLDDSFRYSCL